MKQNFMESLSPAGRSIFREEEVRSSKTVNRVRYLMVLLLSVPVMITAFSSTDPYVPLIYGAAITLYLALTYIHTLALRHPNPDQIRRWNLLAMLGDMTIAISVISYWGLALSPDNIGFMAKIPLWNFMALIILTTIFMAHWIIEHVQLFFCACGGH